MFRCECGRQSDPGEKMKKIVLEQRPMTYGQRKDGSLATGWEIKREGRFGECCYSPVTFAIRKEREKRGTSQKA